MAPSISIIGAGPAGLTLARLLQVEKVNINITIFEGDASATARFYQGGTLDLHGDTGLAALKKAGLFEEFQKHARYEGEELVFADKNGIEFVHMKEASSSDLDARPEIDRETLKDLLLENVDGSIIQWGKKLNSIEPSTGILNFKDGSTAGPFDLVIGCDGAWSKVRPVLTDITPHYSGVCGFECRILEPAQQYPQLSKMVGRGSYFAYSNCRSLTAQRLSDDSIKVGCYLAKDEQHPMRIMAECNGDETALKEKILSAYTDWVPEMQQLVKVATRFRPWALFELPVGHTWEHKKGFTLISDAASLMTPFAGEGVNKGMRDALDLSSAIANCLRTDGDLDLSVKNFELEMFPRAKKVQQETMRNKTHMFREDAPIGFLVAMTDVVVEHLGYNPSNWIMWLITIPVKTAAFCYFWDGSTTGLITTVVENKACQMIGRRSWLQVKIIERFFLRRQARFLGTRPD